MGEIKTKVAKALKYYNSHVASRRFYSRRKRREWKRESTRAEQRGGDAYNYTTPAQNNAVRPRFPTCGFAHAYHVPAYV